VNKEQIQILAENALHEACRHIQDELSITDGLNASIFFCGNREHAIHAIFHQYIEDELMIKTLKA
jgi:hypothetical protein